MDELNKPVNKVVNVDIEREMKKAFESMSVIIARALPDVGTGKPSTAEYCIRCMKTA